MKYVNPNGISIAILCCLMSMACTEFISPNISDLHMEINSPRDSLFTSGAEITFWWEDVSVAESYRLQIVTPDFDNPTLILDTILQKNLITIALAEGIFTWRMRAENASSQSVYIQRIVIRDNTPPYPANPLFPLDSTSLSKQDGITLRWQSKDRVLDGKTFPVSDSLFLFEKFGSSWILKDTYWVDYDSPRTWEVSDIVASGGEYQWIIKSFDQASNVQPGEVYSFFVN